MESITSHDNNGFNFGWGSLYNINESLHFNKHSENNFNTDTIYTIEEIDTFTVSLT